MQTQPFKRGSICCIHAFNGLNFYRFALKSETKAMKNCANDMKKINAGDFMGALPSLYHAFSLRFLKVYTF